MESVTKLIEAQYQRDRTLQSNEAQRKPYFAFTSLKRWHFQCYSMAQLFGTECATSLNKRVHLHDSSVYMSHARWFQWV